MLLLKFRYWILGLTVILTLAAAIFISEMKARYNMEAFFPQNDPAVNFYNTYTDNFHSDARLLLLGIKNQSSVLERGFLLKLDSLTNSLKMLADVGRATSITQLPDARKTPFGYLSRPVLKITSDDYKKDSINLIKDPRILKQFISSDFHSTCLFLEIKPKINEAEKKQLIRDIHRLASKYFSSKYHIAGNINTEVAYIEMLEKEVRFLTPMFLLAMAVLLFFLYRSFFSLFVLMSSVLIGLIWLLGYAALIGRNLDLAVLMFPTIMVVVGMSDLIHFHTKYQQNLVGGMKKSAAIKKGLLEIRSTLFLTSLTTAIGFFSLSFSSIPHVHTFGLDATVGVFMAFLIAITFTPVLLSLLPTPKMESLETKKSDWWTRVLQYTFHFTIAHPGKILWGSLGLFVLSCFGIHQMNTNSFLLGNISKKAEVRKDFAFFENHFSGVRSLEIAILPQKDYKIDRLAVLREIEKVENFLSRQQDIGPIFSPVTYYKSQNKIHHGGQWKHYKLPDYARKDNQQLIEQYRNQKVFSQRDYVINNDGSMGRLSAKMSDQGREYTKEFNQKLTKWIAENTDTQIVRFQSTGSSLLIDKNNEQLINEMFQSLGLAFLIISLLMAFLFRNIFMVFISLIPNILPLIITAGIMGFAGIELNGSSGFIFTISFVIAVDDTIHFLSKYRIERRKGVSQDESLKNTIQSTGKAIIITSLMLAAGYAVCLFSEFRESFYHGFLICLTLLWAVVADLLLLPVILRKFNSNSFF